MSNESLNEPLPSAADLRKLAAKGARFDTSFEVGVLPRIAGMLFEKTGQVRVDLHLGVDQQRVRYLQGRIECDAEIICQRCMTPMPIAIRCDVFLGVAWDEIEAKQLPKAMDPLIVGEDEWADLNEVVEDELLLNMPFVSYHNTSECNDGVKYSFGNAKTAVAVKQDQKKNPFDVLAQLKADN